MTVKIRLRMSLIMSVVFLVTVSTAHAQYSGGSGTADDPYQIATAADLIALGETPDDYDKHFILTADIDLDPNLPGGRVFDRAVIAPDMNDIEYGFQGTRFTGVFDGDNRTISHLTITGASYLGLFGRLGELDRPPDRRGEVANVGIVDATIAGRVRWIGALVGGNDGGTVVGCYSSGTVRGGDHAGGLVGYNLGSITGSHSSGTVMGYYWVGGLAGYNGGHVKQCFSTGTVNGHQFIVGGLVGVNDGNIAASYSTSVVSGHDRVGGLVGDNSGHISASYCTGIVNGDDYIGGLVGGNGGRITTSYSVGTTTGQDQVGGFVGGNWGIIALNYSTGPVDGDEYVGGLVGYNWDSVIASYSASTVNGHKYVGGFVGMNAGDIDVSYSIGLVTGDDRVGGFLGAGGANACFWDAEASGQATSPAGTGVTTAQMQDADTYLNARWDFVDETHNGTCDYWQMSADDYPRLHYRATDGPMMPEGSGTTDDPYLIRDARELGTVWFEPAAHYRLATSLDLSEISWSTAPIPWFWGTFDGNGQVIRNLHVRGGGRLGLIAELRPGAAISDLVMEAVDVKGTGDCVGGLVGQNRGSITSSYSTGAVSGYRNVGGLVGENGENWSLDALLAHCDSNAFVTGQWYVGGLAGRNNGTVTRCQSSSTVFGDYSIGGLIGRNGVGPVTECYSIGAVHGGNTCGGLVGENGYGTIAYSYSLAAVTGDYTIGGLVGYMGFWDMWPDSSERSVLFGCYSAGAVAGECGGLVAASDGSGLVFENASFWDVESSGQSTSAEGTGLPTVEMQDPNALIAAGWDFVGRPDGPHDIWIESEGGGYPILWWQVSPEPSLPEFSGGTGEPNAPYLIATTEDLNSIGHNPRLMKAHFKLVSDLDFTDSRFYPIGNSYGYSWNDVCAYEGVFDGNGHTVSHVTIEGEGRLGVFVALGSTAVVRDLGIIDVNVTGSSDRVGGLVGSSDGTVLRCCTTGVIRGGQFVGGLVGSNGGDVVDSYSACTVSGERCVGGLIGYCGQAVRNCYSVGLVAGATYVSGLLSGCLAESSFWDIETSGQSGNYGGTGKTTAEMQTATTFLEAGWDFVGETANGTDDIWWILEGQDYPRLWWELVEEDMTETAEN